MKRLKGSGFKRFLYLGRDFGRCRDTSGAVQFSIGWDAVNLFMLPLVGIVLFTAIWFRHSVGQTLLKGHVSGWNSPKSSLLEYQLWSCLKSRLLSWSARFRDIEGMAEGARP